MGLCYPPTQVLSEFVIAILRFKVALFVLCYVKRFRTGAFVMHIN